MTRAWVFLAPLLGMLSPPSGAPAPAHEVPYGDLVGDPRAAQALVELAGPAPCEDGLAAGYFPCRGIDLEAYVSLAAMRLGATSGSNLWGFASGNDGREYAVFGLNNGTAVVDVTDPAHPVVVGSIQGPDSLWREVKVYQVWSSARRTYDAYAYVVSEGPTAGLQILDLSELPRAVSLAATARLFDTAHTVALAHVDPATGIWDGEGFPPVLYLDGARNPVAGIAALDLSDPLSPSLLGTYTRSYGHDVWTGVFSGTRASSCHPAHDPCDVVVNWAGDAIRILDWTDKKDPQVIGELTYPDLAYAHSGWISPDRDFLFSMDEYDERETHANTRVRVIDIRDLSAPRLAAVWTGPTQAIEHNGYTRGDRYFMSHYERGLSVLDVSDPLAPAERAFFDTFPPADSAEFHGAWGVYPFLPSGNILVSNLDGAGGLYILRETGPPSAAVPRERVRRASPRSRPAR